VTIVVPSITLTEEELFETAIYCQLLDIHRSTAYFYTQSGILNYFKARKYDTVSEVRS
jgi:hypothetical protein